MAVEAAYFPINGQVIVKITTDTDTSILNLC